MTHDSSGDIVKVREMKGEIECENSHKLLHNNDCRGNANDGEQFHVKIDNHNGVRL